MTWHLTNTAATRAGQVAWGSAGAGPALVLCHGWPWSSFAWHRVIPALTSHFQVYWYDMPGFGRSDMPRDQATDLAVQGQVLCEMLDHWQLDQPKLWAHDFGGAISLRAHLLHGRDYDQLLLMNVVALSPWGSEFFDHVGRHVEAFAGLPDHIHAAVVRAYIQGALAQDIDPSDQEALATPWLSEDGRHAFYHQFAQADDALTDAFAPQLGQMRTPTAVFWGEDDPWIPIARGQELARLTDAPFSPIKGCGHLPQLEDPARVVDMALSFFTAKT